MATDDPVERTFNPLKDNDPSNRDEAVALACAWASGKRSWTNLRASGYSHEAVAAMDAQEVVKYGALAQMFSRLETDAKAFEIFEQGMSPTSERESEDQVEFDPDDLKWETYRAAGDPVHEKGSGLMLTYKPSGVQVATHGPGSMLEKRERLLQQLRGAASVQPDGTIVIDCTA